MDELLPTFLVLPCMTTAYVALGILAFLVLSLFCHIVLVYFNDYFECGESLPHRLSIVKPNIKEIHVFEEGDEIICDKEKLELAYKQLYKTIDIFTYRYRGKRVVNICMLDGSILQFELSQDGKMISKANEHGIFKTWYYVPKKELLFNKIKSE